MEFLHLIDQVLTFLHHFRFLLAWGFNVELEAQLLGEIVHHGFIGAASNASEARVNEGSSGRALLHVPVAA